ncbi:MAG: hypothetical protein ACI8TQ_003958 [Planctomycetota bacterium]|jgi:hypothetical protein
MFGINDHSFLNRPHSTTIASPRRKWLLTSTVAAFILAAGSIEAAEIIGNKTKWHPLEVRFSGGVSFCETSGPTTDGMENPFLDRRLNVTFTHFNAQSVATHTQVVPGFFVGDGSGGPCGNRWIVRFTPDAAGTWTYTASFRQGVNINISLAVNAGSPLLFNGDTDAFTVKPLDKQAPGFLGKGRLEYVGEHYLKHRDGGFFIKGGTDSPENLFGATAFDDTFDQSGGDPATGLTNGIHRFASHEQDFGPTGLGDSNDPFWTSNIGGNSRAIIGLLNYLSSKDVNSIYFLPMNLGGDGRETYPFVSPDGSNFANTHFDLSKLRQWNTTLNHAQEKGLLWNCVLSETEVQNETWFGTNPNILTNQRKLFFREMVARYGYLNGIKWNLGEESDFSVQALRSFANYITSLDPYDHIIAFHTNNLPSNGAYPDYVQVLGDQRFSATSLQHLPNQVGRHIEKWRTDSANSGRKWIVESDEQIGGISSTNQDLRRKTTLYDILFSGGNIEWYFGDFPMPDGGDLNAEDMRTREDMWEYTAYARKFLTNNLDFVNMSPADDLVAGESATHGGAEVFALPGKAYAVYYPDATATGNIKLPEGIFKQRWFSPRTGRFAVKEFFVTGGYFRPVGAPPLLPGEDWVTLYEINNNPYELAFDPISPGLPSMMNTSSLNGGSPDGPILIFYSFDGTGTYPLPTCQGVSYNLTNTQYGFTLFADPLGNAKINSFVNPGPTPGTTIYLQALDPFACAVSPVTTFTW